MHSHQKAENGMRMLSEISVDHYRTGMGEVECCLGQVSSEAGDRDCASEQDKHNQAQRALGKVWL